MNNKVFTIVLAVATALLGWAAILLFSASAKAQTQQKYTQFETKIVVCKESSKADNGGECRSLLSLLGDAGWEIKAVKPFSSSYWETTVYLQRARAK